MILATPLNTTAEILFELITNGSVSMKEFSWMEGFRTRVSELNRKHHIPLLKTTEEGQNKHGNAIRYHRHSLPNEQKEFALEVYQKINQN